MSDELADLAQRFRVPPDTQVDLEEDFDPADTARIDGKKAAQGLLDRAAKRLGDLQDRLYAQDTHALLLILQGMDAAGKDGAIEHVMRDVDPQGCTVHSFKAPSKEELDHDFLWRHVKALPERGRIGIFNRSWYEEVLVVRVHPELLEAQRLPPSHVGTDLWEHRYRSINGFERHLVENGTTVVKIFLHMSRAEQRERFLARIDEPNKNWKFSMGDVDERRHWDAYQHAYEQMLSHTSTPWAPWHVVPADRKWFARVAVGAVIVEALRAIDPQFPKPSPQHEAELLKARDVLTTEE